MLPSDDSFIFENRLPLMYIVHSTIRWNDFGILTMLKSRWVIYDPPQANQVHQESNGPLVCPTVVIPCSPSQLQSSEKSSHPLLSISVAEFRKIKFSIILGPTLHFLIAAKSVM